MLVIDPEILFTILLGTIVLIAIGSFLVVFLLQYQKRKFQHFHEVSQLKETFESTLLQTQFEIQEQTLKTISQEIHDNIGQVLSLAKLNLNTVDINKQEQLLNKISSSKELVSKAIQDLRDLSKSLNTDMIAANGLIPSIEYELEMIKKTGEYDTQLQVNGNIVKADPQKELILFRIVQEILNNIIKHAGAKLIRVQVAYTPAELELIITDDGKGFNLEPMNNEETRPTASGLGIRNMHSRAKLIGADFSISSIICQGTSVKIKFPVNS